MEGNAPDGLALEVEDIAKFRDGEEPEPACKYEDAGGDVHDWVVLETDERVGEQREPHTAEGTDRLEQRTKYAVIEFHRIKLRKIDDSADCF